MGFQWPGVELPEYQTILCHGCLLAAQGHCMFFPQRVPQVLAEVSAGEEPFLERKVKCINATVLFCCTLTRLAEVEHCFGF